MSKVDELVDAFCGKGSKKVRVRSGDCMVELFVDFGIVKLTLPRGVEVDDESVRVEGGHVTIVPEVVKKIIAEDGFLCSGYEPHVRALEEWFRKEFPKVLRKVLAVERRDAE